MKNLSLLICLLWSSSLWAASDVIEINKVYVTTDGRFAVQAKTIPSEADAEGNCHSTNEGWARVWFGFEVNEKSQSLVATILSAHARGSKIKIESSGCYGDWHKIAAVYTD